MFVVTQLLSMNLLVVMVVHQSVEVEDPNVTEMSTTIKALL